MVKDCASGEKGVLPGAWSQPRRYDVLLSPPPSPAQISRSLEPFAQELRSVDSCALNRTPFRRESIKPTP